VRRIPVRVKVRAGVLSAGLLLAVAVPVATTASAAPAKPAKVAVQASCATAPAGYARCLALRVVSGTTGVSSTAGVTANAATGAPAGWHPADLQRAYRLDASKGKGQTVAIVDAYDDPNAESDMAFYRSSFGLPPCTTANGCFRKVNQRGGSTLPIANAGWAEEISLDLDMVSAVCPHCNILLVEGDTGIATDLGQAVDTAVTLGATEVSNSYGYRGTPAGRMALAVHYDHPGVPITVSSGDDGYASPANEIPAVFTTVTAVGGTSLKSATNARGFTETAWDGAGSVCGLYGLPVRWQTTPGCARRMISDVSAVADPATGVTVYDTYGKHDHGFEVFGGTSVSSPIIASVYALAGNGATVNDAHRLYEHTASLFDVTSGSNGPCAPRPAYFCNGVPGYDGPTGLGTPDGSGAF
jgi:subtilase family serine protease